MALSRNIRVMISSRCNDRFPAGSKNSPTLSTIRKDLKKEIEAQELFGDTAFEVWINEVAPPQGGTWDSWEVCLNAVRDCDVLLVLYNGNAGWAGAAGDIGICHDELSTAYSTAAGKVWLIDLGAIPVDNSDAGKRNKRFQEYVAKRTPFRGGEVKTLDELKQRVREALRDAVVTLVQSGVIEASRGRFDSGQALDWSRMMMRGAARRFEGRCSLMLPPSFRRLGGAGRRFEGRVQFDAAAKLQKIRGWEEALVPASHRETPTRRTAGTSASSQPGIWLGLSGHLSFARF
ncbi:MAG TPA: DUF4062 domain-containing protein [Blastocatellia bacterium]|nr:DUF4062 domain-containing protein [Blastocatellia bacterium]